MSDGKEAIKCDLDAETIAEYRALEERYLAELRQVRLVIRRAQQRRAYHRRRRANSGRRAETLRRTNRDSHVEMEIFREYPGRVLLLLSILKFFIH